MNPSASCSSSFKGSYEAGFSLLELAIVLVILGIIGGVSIPLVTTHMTRTALFKTRANQDYVLSAIAVYVGKHNRFPCPAEAHIVGAKFGMEPDRCRMEDVKGIIPFKTLGISESYASDGFKRLMTYVVEPDLAKRDTTLGGEKGGFITVKNEAGFPVLPTPQKAEKNPNHVAVVLISHGENGVGAYIGKGQTGKFIGHALSPHKRENCDENFVFIESSQSDDILRWESRDQFLQHYVGGVRRTKVTTH